ncbi:hypothetical protein GH5_01592 [Leishmania sp. Ghana 2012 LV757]|uniref:hypothetical protein n=1 Tax=Leishmania sp. Ghana 2012 LV757 TaxID=2803181 RepID=UPI001B4BD209|nr:hypothetical protein GH5_01592 [Leishmania sp. Ghana 2012 LV757]
MSDHDDQTSPTRTCAPREVHLSSSCCPRAKAVSPIGRSDVRVPPSSKRPIPAPLTSLHSLVDTHRTLHSSRYASPSQLLERPLPRTQPNFSDVAKRIGSSNDMCEPSSLFSSHLRFGDMSSLGISGSTSTAPAGCSDSTTPLHWLRVTEERVIPHARSIKAAPVVLRPNAEYVFERWVERRVLRTTAIDDAMLSVAAAFDELWA